MICSTWTASTRRSYGRSLFACLIWLTLTAPSVAGEGLVGRWEGSGEGKVTASVRADPDRTGHFLAEIDTESGACSGRVEVSGKLSNVSVATAEPPYAGAEVCRIELRLSGPDRLRVSEVDNCIFFHGASCGFTGELTRRGVSAQAVPPRSAKRPQPPAGGRGGHVPWAPDCEFLHLNSAYAPVEVTGTVSPEAIDCYAIKPNAGTEVTIEVAKGRNIVFSISDLVDAVERHQFRANGYGRKVTVGQLMRSATQEPYRITFSSGAILPLPNAASARSTISIAEVQQLLNKAGFEAGPVDGKMGGKTRRAIRRYQSENGLKITGKPDADLMRSLQSNNVIASNTAIREGGAASAKELDVPVIEQGGDGQAANCASSVVAGLKADGDGFLGVRSGPGTQYRKIDELHNGDVVYTYDQKGDWLGIAYDVSTIECASKTTRPVPYDKKGWVHGDWLEDLAG